MTLFLPLLIWRHVQIFYHQSYRGLRNDSLPCSLRQCEFCFYIAVNYRSPLGKYAIMPTQNIDIWNQTKWGVGKRVLRRWLIANVHTRSVDPNCATQMKCKWNRGYKSLLRDHFIWNYIAFGYGVVVYNVHCNISISEYLFTYHSLWYESFILLSEYSNTRHGVIRIKAIYHQS